MDKGLSNIDIQNLLKNQCNIIMYPDLKYYKNIDQLLDPYGCAVILYKSKPKYGHWVVLNKTDPSSIEFFNSYGGLPDETLDFINKGFRKQTDQNYPYLSKLLYDSPYDLYFNEFKFQKDSKDIRTCGRHVVVRAFLKKYDIYQYKKILDDLCRAYNKKTYDELVTFLTENNI